MKALVVHRRVDRVYGALQVACIVNPGWVILDSADPETLLVIRSMEFSDVIWSGLESLEDRSTFLKSYDVTKALYTALKSRLRIEPRVWIEL